MEVRQKKQLIIGSVFALLIAGAVYGLVDRFFIIEATCFDKVRNGKEEGVDCGTLACGIVCEEPVRPLQVSEDKLIRIGLGDYDFVAKIFNPNTHYGASQIDYSIGLAGAGIKRGTTYLLPGQTKYVVATSLRTPTEVASAGLKVNSIQWEKINMPAGEVELVNRRGVFSEDKSSFEGVVFNDSNYDFDSVEVSVILFDSSNFIVGVNRTEIRTLLARTERSFKVIWPAPQNTAARADVQISTNLFENSNFIKSYGTQERFQEFY